jgi:hypothetical protein
MQAASTTIAEAAKVTEALNLQNKNKRKIQNASEDEFQLNSYEYLPFGCFIFLYDTARMKIS